MALLVGFVWLAPYSPSQSVTVRMRSRFRTSRVADDPTPVRAATQKALSIRAKEKPGVLADVGLHSITC